MSEAASARPLIVYLIAGESSGDLLGARLMHELKQTAGREVRFKGIGGERMQAEGIKSLFAYHELSLMGFVEVLPHALKMLARIDLTVNDILSTQPDVVVTIDSPGFCFRVVEKLRKENARMKFVHYVAPTVWAYRPERAERCAKLFDHMLVLLPFEPEYFHAAGLDCTFVGHSVVAENTPGDGKAFREKYEIGEDTLLLSLLPGSRKGEVQRHMPSFARAIDLLATLYPKLAMAVTVPKHVLPFVASFFEGCPYRAVISANEQDKKNSLAASNFAIVKSGTIALEVAQAGVPMIVSYRVHPFSAWMMRRMAKTKYVNLVNILSKEEVIPELLQELCTPLAIASSASELLADPAKQKAQVEKSRQALAQLLPPGGESPSRLAAEKILSLLGT